MRSLGHLKGVTDVDLAEAKGQSTSVVDKCYRGMKAVERKSSTQLRWTLLMEVTNAWSMEWVNYMHLGYTW